MIRPLLAIALLAACASDVGKDDVLCGPSWAVTPPVDGTCDSACVEMNPGTGASCTTTIAYGGSGNYVCQSTFVFDGVRGCCLDTGRISKVKGLGEPERTRRVFFLSCD